MNYLTGIKGLAASKKAMLSLIVLAVSATLAYLGKLDLNFAAIMGVVQVIYCYSVTKTELGLK